MKHHTTPLRFVELLSGLLCAVVACSTQPAVAPSHGAGTPASAEPYRIRPGDELEVRFFHTPENNITLLVRPDGFISLPLVYELQAAGRTVENLRRELLDRYQAEFADPELAVIVKKVGTYPVHVGGEVASPGVLQFADARNVLEAVVAAGGFLPSADPAAVIVVRRGIPTGYELLDADLDELLAGGDSAGNVVLRPYDVIYVPRSPIAEVNKWVDQYLRKNLPITFTYRLDNP